MNCSSLKKWQIHKPHGAVCVFLIFSLYITAAAQFQETEFFDRVNSIYYTLEQTELENFTAWLTSNTFVNATDGYFKEEVFPLEFIWLSNNKMFFSRRPVPVLEDSIKNEQIERLQLSMRTELKALLLDWQRFYSGRLLAGMPPDYTLDVRADTVILQYTTIEGADTAKNVLFFGKNGICLKTVLAYPGRNERIETYPVFKYTGEKWLCIGWQVQVFEGDEVTTGYLVEVKAQRIETFWLPQVFIMTLQTQRDKDSIYIREFYFRNILINRNIEVMN